MSTTELSFMKAKSGVRNADFIAFVADRKTEQVLKSFVLEQAMPHAHIAIGNVDDAIAHLSKIERSPLFLLVDLQDSVMPLSDLGRLAEVCEPSVQVVALGERNDVGPVPQPAQDRRARLSRQAAHGRTAQAHGQCVRGQGEPGDARARGQDDRVRRHARRRRRDDARAQPRPPSGRGHASARRLRRPEPVRRRGQRHARHAEQQRPRSTCCKTCAGSIRNTWSARSSPRAAGCTCCPPTSTTAPRSSSKPGALPRVHRTAVRQLPLRDSRHRQPRRFARAGGVRSRVARLSRRRPLGAFDARDDPPPALSSRIATTIRRLRCC